MVVTIAASAMASNVAVTTQFMSVPGTAAGDISFGLISVVCTNAVINVPAGWNAIPPGSTRPIGRTDGASIIIWRAWQPGDPANVAVTWNASGRVIILPFRIRGGYPADPVRKYAVTPYDVIVANGSVGAPSLDATTSRFLVCCFAIRITSAGSQATWSPVTGMGMTELEELSVSSASANPAAAVYYQDLTTAGATGVKNAKATQQGNSTAWSFLIETEAAVTAGSVLRTQAGVVEARRKVS